MWPTRTRALRRALTAPTRSLQTFTHKSRKPRAHKPPTGAPLQLDESMRQLLRDTDMALLAAKGRAARYPMRVPEAEDVRAVFGPEEVVEDEDGELLGDGVTVARRSPAALFGGRQGPRTLDLPVELVERMQEVVAGACFGCFGSGRADAVAGRGGPA